MLAPVAASAAAARELVGEVLAKGSRQEWLDNAQLAVSELVTNAVLHAHTPIDVHVVLTRSSCRVEVRDRNPVIPVARDWGAEAATGRGVSLAAAVSTSFGVTPLPPEGKVVWFCLDDDATRVAELDEDALLDLWDEEEPEAAGGTKVSLRCFPPALWLAAREHHDAILRDLALYVVGHPETALTEEDRAGADHARQVVAVALDQALAQLEGLPDALDLDVVVPRDRVAAFPVLQDVLDVAERLAVDDQLLVRPALPEVVALRDWVCEQVVTQAKGGPPGVWGGAAAPRFTVQATETGLPAWDVEEVAGSQALLVAADDANRVLAVSGPLADALGWDAAELVGRRLVAIVPPRLREAHVVGFTRYLATGQRRMLGAPVSLPVLHADGRELDAQLIVQERHGQEGRTVFVAQVELVDG